MPANEHHRRGRRPTRRHLENGLGYARYLDSRCIAQIAKVVYQTDLEVRKPAFSPRYWDSRAGESSRGVKSHGDVRGPEQGAPAADWAEGYFLLRAAPPHPKLVQLDFAQFFCGVGCGCENLD